MAKFGDLEAKIVLAKVLELAYSKNKGLTTKILAKNGYSALSIDDDGRVTLSSSLNILTFSGKPVLDNIGVKLNRFSVTFSNQNKMRIGYTGSVDLTYSSISFSGSLDLESLIKACSGLLCQAANLLSGRKDNLDEALYRAVVGY